eukprot:218648_1
MVSLLLIALYFVVQSQAKSFAVSSNALSYAEAQNYCENKGMTVASILTADEKEEAHSLCRTKTTSSGCWIGLQDPDFKGDWTWDDGSAGGYAFNGDSPSTGQDPWDDGEPASDDAKLCVRMRGGSSGQWTIYKCSKDLHGLCSSGSSGSSGTTPTKTTTKDPTKKPTTKSPTNQAITPTKKPTAKPTSGSSSTNDGDRVYKGFSSSSGWADAKDKCEEEGMALAVIENDDELEAAQIACEDVSGSKGCYIGATQESGSWKWVNGDRVSYDNWASGHPKSGECARMPNSGTWVSYSCSQEIAFICSGGGSGSGSSTKTTKTPTSAAVKITKQPTKSSGSSGSRPTSDEIWDPCSYTIANTGKISKYFIAPITEKMSWTDGQRACKKLGTTLATIESDAQRIEAAEVCWKCALRGTHFNTDSADGCWIGLSDQNGWEWDDGSELKYGFDDNGDPVRPKDANVFKSIPDDDYIEIDRNIHKFVAHKNSGPNETKGRKASTGQKVPDGKFPLCNTADHLIPVTPDPPKITGKYFAIYDRRYKWKEGRQACFDKGATLATILNDKHNTEALRVCESARDEHKNTKTDDVKTDGCWIGLNDEQAEGHWIWEDGSKITSFGFKNADPDRPNQGRFPWRTMDNGRKHPYMCETEDCDVPFKDYVMIHNSGKWMTLDGGRDDSTPNHKGVLCNVPYDSDAMTLEEESKKSVVMAVFVVCLVIALCMVIAGCVMYRKKKKQWGVEVKDEEEADVNDAVEEGGDIEMNTSLTTN